MLNSENVPKKSSRSPTKQYKGIFFISITNDFENVKRKDKYGTDIRVKWTDKLLLKT